MASRVKIEGIECWASDGYSDVQFLKHFAFPDKLFSSPEMDVCINSRNRQVGCITIAHGGEPKPFYVKRYRPRGGLHAVMDLLFSPRAKNAWRTGCRFAELGIPTPAHAAVLDRCLKFMKHECVLVTRAVTDAQPLRALLDQAVLPPGPRRAMSLALCSVLAKMHRLGVYHADMKIKNVMVADVLSRAPRLYLLDLDRTMCFGRWLRPVVDVFRVVDLRKLNHSLHDLVSQRERLRFFCHYARELGLGRWRRRAFLWGIMIPKSRRHRERMLRRREKRLARKQRKNAKEIE